MKIVMATAAAALALAATPLAAEEHGDEKTAAASEEFLELTEGRVAGEPKTCIFAPHAGSDLRLVENVGLVYDRGETIWIALARNPDQVDTNDVPIFERHGSSLCRHDISRTVDRHTGIFAGTLFLDDFVPYTKVEAEAE